MSSITTRFDLNYAHVAKPTLLVCAGTVTCTKISQMEAGMSLFKSLFGKAGSWATSHQAVLDAYHNDKQSINPLYVYPSAKNGQITGAIATVAVRESKGINAGGGSKRNSTHQQELDYKAAVTAAIEYGYYNNMDVIIQPLGIGVYGWSPKKAAQLFHQAIQQAKETTAALPPQCGPALQFPNITIALYDQSANSNDRQFEKAFEISSLEIKADSNDDAKLKFLILSLATNIEFGLGGRSTASADKAQKLRDLLPNIGQDGYTTAQALDDIRAVCRQRRHAIFDGIMAFFCSPKTPHSLRELEDHYLELPLLASLKQAETSAEISSPI